MTWDAVLAIGVAGALLVVTALRRRPPCDRDHIVRPRKDR